MKHFGGHGFLFGMTVGVVCWIDFGGTVVSADQGRGDAVPVSADNVSVSSASGTNTLMETLRTYGWGVDELDDGSLALYPPSSSVDSKAEAPTPASPVTVTEAMHWQAERLEDGSLILYQVPYIQPGAASLDEAAIREELTSRGWGLRLGEDGSVDFYPLGDGGETSH